MKQVNILSEIDGYELSQICDALKTKTVSENEYIIKQNEEGDNFYIIEQGEAIATKRFEGSNEEKKVKDYNKGDYFGELALIKNEPRAATIIAKVIFNNKRLTAGY